MPANELLTQAIIDGTKEIFQSLEMVLENAPPENCSSGDLHGQVICLLTFRKDISGSFCFKCGIDFASIICQKMIGMDGLDNEYEMLKDAVAEILNWISGAVKRHYVHGQGILISTPSIFVWEQQFEAGGGDEQVDFIRFFYEEHEFTIEITVDE